MLQRRVEMLDRETPPTATEAAEAAANIRAEGLKYGTGTDILTPAKRARLEVEARAEEASTAFFENKASSVADGAPTAQQDLI